MKSDLNILMCVVASLKKQLVCSSDVRGSQFEDTTSGMQF